MNQKHGVYGFRAPATVSSKSMWPHTQATLDSAPLSASYDFSIYTEHPMPFSALELHVCDP